MVIKELENCLDFMVSLGFSNEWGAKLLSNYFYARYVGETADSASRTVFTEIDSQINREILLKEKIAAFHKKLCRLEGFAPEDVSEAIEEFYKSE